MPAPHRILYICHDGDLYGSQRSLSLIVANLPAAQYQCFVSVARPGPLVERLKALPNVTVLTHRRLQWVKHDKRTLAKRLGDLASLCFGALPRVFALAAQIKKHRVDLVHTNSSVSLEGALAARLSGIPHVWHMRELFMEENPKLHLVLGKALSRRMIVRLSDRVLCISEAVRRQFGPDLKVNPDKFPVIYNALAAEAEKPSSPDSGRPELPQKSVFRLGYIGRLSAGKRFGDLLEALSRLREQGLSCELWVAGNFVDEAYEAQIRDQLKQANLSSSVHLLGYVSDVAPLLKTLDVLVLPSLNEPFGRVLIEAMLAGVPCVAADSGGVPEIITDGVTGWLYPPGDAEALAGRLAGLIREPAMLGPVCENAGRQVRERFTIEEQIGMLDACYRSVLNNQA